MRHGFRAGTLRYTIFLMLLLFISTAHAESINQTDGVAVKGYDPVAFFAENRAVKGSDRYTAKYQNITYKFESAANRNSFNANPAKYAPQYGGFCAYGVAHGHKVDISPEAFSVVNGKLYLNYDRPVRFLWERDVPGNINKADQNWPGISRTADAR